MANMMDYLTWRGDLTLEASPWCAVDSLIMASFCYNDLGDHVSDGKGMSLRELAPLLDLKERTGNQYFVQWRDLLYAMAATVRFQDMRIHDYVDMVDPARPVQFSAVTAELSNGASFVAFRGTDNTLVGWREDFNMSYESPVPAQQEAVAYLEYIALHTDGLIMVGGHSKGGNLAAYAAAHVSEEVQRRLTGVYSFDGPGLDDETVSSPGYARIRPVLWSVIPQSSVVGLLMNYHQGYTVVHSTAISLLQHDAFTWQIEGPRFVQLRGVDKGSALMDRTVHEWLKACTPEQRRTFVDTVFTLLESTRASTLAEMSAEKLRSAAAIVTATLDMDADVRKMLMQLLGQFISIGAAGAWDMLTERPRQLLQDRTVKEENRYDS